LEWRPGASLTRRTSTSLAKFRASPMAGNRHRGIERAAPRSALEQATFRVRPPSDVQASLDPAADPRAFQEAAAKAAIGRRPDKGPTRRVRRDRPVGVVRPTQKQNPQRANAGVAASINDRDAAAKIEALAEEYKRRAGALSASKEAEAHKGFGRALTAASIRLRSASLRL